MISTGSTSPGRFSFNKVVTATLSKNSVKKNNRLAPSSSYASSPFPSLRYSFNTTDLNGLVLVEQLYLTSDTSAQLIHRSCQMSGKQYTYYYEHTLTPLLCTCTFQLGTFSTTGSGASKELAKHAAADAAVEKLRKICHTIQIKAHVTTATGVSLQELKGNEVAPLDDSNVGNKLLRLMGWTGGGLGKSETGIQAPIDTSNNLIGRSRLGLGNSARTADGKVKETFTVNEVEGFLMKEFQNQSAHSKEIVFSSEFSKEEREIIHRLAHRLHLKSKSYGKGENRCLLISHKVTLPGLLQQIINDEGESEKYRVLYPETCDANAGNTNTGLETG